MAFSTNHLQRGGPYVFERLDDFHILPRMTGTGADVGEAELLQNDAIVALVKLDVETLLYDTLEIDAPLADNPFLFNSRSGLHDPGEFRELAFRQAGLDAATMPVEKAIGVELVEPVLPIAQGLPVHAANARRILPAPAFDDCCKRHKTAALAGIL